MPIRPPALIALALVLGAAGARAEEAVFDFYMTGIRIGEVTLESEQADGGYTAASRISTAGLLGMVADFWYNGTAEGELRADGTVVPRRFVAKSKSPRAIRDTDIAWEDGTPVSVNVEPPRSSAPEPAAQAGTLDPVSAGFAVLRDRPPDGLCDTAVDVFDGSRRSRLELGAVERRDDAFVCEGTYARLEGEAHTLSSQREFPFELVFRATGAGLARIERIETQTRFGAAVLERRS